MRLQFDFTVADTNDLAGTKRVCFSTHTKRWRQWCQRPTHAHTLTQHHDGSPGSIESVLSSQAAVQPRKKQNCMVVIVILYAWFSLHNIYILFECLYRIKCMPYFDNNVSYLGVCVGFCAMCFCVECRRRISK